MAVHGAGVSDVEHEDLGQGARVELHRELPVAGAMDRLLAELPLAEESYRMGGWTVKAPRLVAFHGDPGTGYVYSGLHHEPSPWTPTLGELRERVQETTGLTFNAVLANLYRQGSDSMGWHADAEPEIGPAPADRWVASLSLGAARRFVLKHRKTGERRVYELGEGDLLVMRGTTQTHWRHALPKTKKPVGPRLNLTFRHIVQLPR